MPFTADRFLQLEYNLSDELDSLTFSPPINTVYRPLIYARVPHELFVRQHFPKGGTGIDVLFIGMNPGPFGMCQTGVPFGDVESVRDFLRVSGKVEAPERVHAKRPVQGFDCRRREISGSRLWGWIRDETNGDPSRFFSRCFIYNYCNLVFMDDAGRNITPAVGTSKGIVKAERLLLESACDRYLKMMIEECGCQVVIGIGGYTTAKAKLALTALGNTVDKDRAIGIRLETIPHPSPLNSSANQHPGWAALTNQRLCDLGLKERVFGEGELKQDTESSVSA